MTLQNLGIARRQAAVPGIIGGLGPLAHIQFEQVLLEQSRLRGANCDQDHPEWILINATQTPDRTNSIKGHAASCAPWLVRYGQILEMAGADFLVVTCNTAHAFYDAVQSQLRLPWIPLMECTTRQITETYPSVRRVGILATDGTLQAQLYHRSLTRAGLVPICPPVSSPMQKWVMQSIYHPEWGIKATGIQISEKAVQDLMRVTNWLNSRGAEVVIAGCTELSVGLAQISTMPIPWIDPLRAIADITLDLSYGDRSLRSLSVA